MDCTDPPNAQAAHPPPPGPPARRPPRWLWWAGLAAVAAAVAAAWSIHRWRAFHTTSPAEPYSHLHFESPFQNVREGVRYVGDAACARCHPGIAESYSGHPMGQALFPTDAAPAIESFDTAAHNPFTANGLEYRVFREGGKLFHQELRRDGKGRVVAQRTAAIDYVLGSGSHGRSYLLNLEGRLFQSPISWYSQKRRWDLSPGYEHKNLHFGRSVNANCLYCHSNRVDAVEHTYNNYREPIFRGHVIGCERCHGPGELHVQLHTSKSGVNPDIDYTIVNPRHLEPLLRDSVCQQCHLQGVSKILRAGRDTFDFRPGAPLHLYWSIFVLPDQFTKGKAVSQVEQMEASRCFQSSAGKMGCISCHDPHWHPPAEQKARFYRERCLNCHHDRGCSVPAAERLKTSKEDSCTQCHMPRLSTTDVVHLAISDHRVLRNPATHYAPPDEGTAPGLGDTPLIDFFQKVRDPRDRGVSRDLALALLALARGMEDSPAALKLAEKTLPLTESAIAANPDDVAAWAAKGYSLWLQGWGQEALAAYEATLAKAPQAESAIVDAAELSRQLGHIEKARDYWERAVKLNPYSAYYWERLAHIYALRRDWPRAVVTCRKAVELDPANLSARRLLVECCSNAGDREAAQREFETLLAFDPPDAQALRARFATPTR